MRTTAPTTYPLRVELKRSASWIWIVSQIPDRSRQHVEHGQSQSQLKHIGTILTIGSEAFHRRSVVQCDLKARPLDLWMDEWRKVSQRLDPGWMGWHEWLTAVLAEPPPRTVLCRNRGQKAPACVRHICLTTRPCSQLLLLLRTVLKAQT